MSAQPAIERPAIGVLAVQGGVREHVVALKAVGASPHEVRRAEDLARLDGLVIPGGESTTLGLVAGRSGLLAALRAAIGAGLPTFGTCAGMVMLAGATTGGPQPLIGGMDVIVRRNAFGRQRSSFEADVAVAGLGPEPMRAVFIRAPWVERAGSAVTPLAHIAGRPVAVRQGHLLTTAFHPELTGDRRLHAAFMEMVRAASPAARERRARVGAQ